MQQVLLRVAHALLRAVKRFLANQPANPYETIIFGATRAAAYTFGRTVKAL